MAEEHKGPSMKELELEVDITTAKFKAAFEAYKVDHRFEEPTRELDADTAKKRWALYRDEFVNAGDKGRRATALGHVMEQQLIDDGVRKLAKGPKPNPEFCAAYDAFCRLLDLGKEDKMRDSEATKRAREEATRTFAHFTHAYARQDPPYNTRNPARHSTRATRDYEKRRDAVGRVMTMMVHEDTNRDTLVQDMGTHLDLVAATKNTNECGMLFMLFGATMFFVGIGVFVYINKLEPWHVFD